MRARQWIGFGAIAAVLVLLILQLVGERASTTRAMGYYLEEGDRRLVVAEVMPGDPADRAGLVEGDVLVSARGERLEDTEDYDRVASTFRSGQSVLFVVERDSELFEIEVGPGIPFDWLRYWLNALAVVLHLVLVGVILVSGVRGLSGRLLLFLLLAIAVELALPQRFIGQPALEQMVVPLLSLVIGLQFGIELHLASRVPGPHPWLERAPALVPCGYLAGLGWGITTAAMEVPALGESAALRWMATPPGDVVFEVWYWLWPLGVLVLLSTAALRWKNRRGRQQAMLVLAGVIPWVLMTGVATYRMFRDLPVSPVSITLERIEPLILLLYPLAIFTALYRLHLFDFRLVVRKGLVYTILVTALLLGFYAALGGAGALLSTLVEDPVTSMWVIVLASLVLGLAFGPVRRSLENLIERRFFPERTGLRKRLGDLARELPRHGNLSAIAEKLAAGLTDIFAVEGVTVLLAESAPGRFVRRSLTYAEAHGLAHESLVLSKADRLARELISNRSSIVLGDWAGTSALATRLRTSGVAVVLPIAASDELVGLVLVGEKNGGLAFPAEEVELLELFSSHIATVLDNVSLFETATVDGLTGLLRREAVLARLDTELARTTRYQRPLAVAMIDLDHFKRINDRHGHPMGDVILRRVARAIAESVRTTDALGRYGGEEFLLVLPETPLETALTVSKGLREKIESLRVETEDGVAVRITISIGLASAECAPTGEAPSLEDLVGAADRSLYAAKSGGRNRVAFLDDPDLAARASAG